jgi:hypothetical protein
MGSKDRRASSRRQQASKDRKEVGEPARLWRETSRPKEGQEQRL